VTAAAVAVVGGGRVGLSLARALSLAGHPVTVLSRSVRPLEHPLTTTSVDWAGVVRDTNVLLLAVPDDRIAEVAVRLHETGAVTPGHTVLHSSGRLDREALAVLGASGAALGSLHPLQSFRNENGGGTLGDVPAILEGDVGAVAVAREIAARLEMQPIVEIPASGKAEYHAAAVFASNYLVVLAALAERLGREAGLATDWRLFLPLMRQTLGHLAEHSPEASLTGPIRRGDVGTVRAHLMALDEPMRGLYAALGREALELARPELEPGIIAELKQVLRD
jgi:predicted short-subunit dehydrogenase-like oxidoreductase (DUF2520 family)